MNQIETTRFKQFEDEYSDYLKEDIDIVNGKLEVNTAMGDDSGISSSFGKSKKLSPYRKKISGVDDLVSYSLYQAKTDNSTDVLKALKKADFRDEDVAQFINRSAVYAYRLLRKQKVDVIVSPKSSSDLTKEFVNQIKRRGNYDVIVDAFTKKKDISKVEIDRDHPKITDKIIKSMERILKRAEEQGHLSVKMFSVQHRKFIKNLFDVADKRIYNKVAGKNVVVIDDVMTSGTTTKNIYDILRNNQAEEIVALTMFKAS